MGRSWELAPAYDVTHAYNPQGEWTYQHLISVDGKFNSISRADLLVEAPMTGSKTVVYRQMDDDEKAVFGEWGPKEENS